MLLLKTELQVSEAKKTEFLMRSTAGHEGQKRSTKNVRTYFAEKIMDESSL
jgi:hypothetical protein